VSWPLLRGQVVQVDIHLDEPKLVVIVSNNRRNRQLDSVLAVRLTSSAKPDIPSVVELGTSEVFHGRAVCDNVIEVFEDEVLGVRGGLTADAIDRINAGLRAALDLD